MSNPSKQKGTTAEVAVVSFLNETYWPYAERRPLSGVNDRGDIAGIPGVVIEVKNHQKMELAQWMDEAKRERRNDNASYGVVWHKRRGTTKPAEWYVTMTGQQFADLLREAGY